jgi:hypothetical protein
VDPEFDIIDPESGHPFSREFLTKCGFLYCLDHTPEEIIAMEQGHLSYFTHEFSRTYRSVFPDAGDRIEMGCLYRSMAREHLGRKSGQPKFSLEELEAATASAPGLRKAQELILEFENEMAGLASELFILNQLIMNNHNYLVKFGLYQFDSKLKGKSPVEYESEALKDSDILTQGVALNFLLREVMYNAEKVAGQRGIPFAPSARVSSLGFGQLPQDISSRFQGYDPSEYSCWEGMPILESAQYIKISFSDNAGGFDQPVEHYLPDGVSGTGSTGKGLGQIMSAQKNLFCAIDLINRPGEGATYDFYFVAAPVKTKE